MGHHQSGIDVSIRIVTSLPPQQISSLRPVQNLQREFETLNVRFYNKASKLVATFQFGVGLVGGPIVPEVTGNFMVALKPGTYFMTAEMSTSPDGPSPPQTLVVEKKGYTPTSISIFRFYPEPL
jgi:hypothetical protein